MYKKSPRKRRKREGDRKTIKEKMAENFINLRKNKSTHPRRSKELQVP